MHEVFEQEERRGDSKPTGIILPNWLAIIVVGGMFGLGITAISNQTRNSQEIALLTLKIEVLSKQIADGMDERYRSSDARADFALRDSRIDILYTSRSDCQSRIRSIEKFMYNKHSNLNDKNNINNGYK